MTEERVLLDWQRKKTLGASMRVTFNPDDFHTTFHAEAETRYPRSHKLVHDQTSIRLPIKQLKMLAKGILDMLGEYPEA